ncbi:MAG: sugar phosphate nucleotidyltransferase [bacterium]|nr:sugar phosphate nucleotidyltransferase [bacterium]
MKGIVLAGGLGTRLDPLTRVTNKHLLPVYDRPMIYYPLETLIAAGITEIMLVTGGQSAGGFLELLGNGHELGLEHLNYTYQKGHGGIAEALGLCEHFIGGDRMCVILGDNLLQHGIGDETRAYEAQPGGARILLKEVPDPMRFGVPVFDGKGKILRIEEKPKKPASPYAVIGVYFYDDLVWDIIRGLSPSGRNELEISDVNNAYLKRGLLEHGFVDGWWTDAGTFESLFRASDLVRREVGGEGRSP